MHDSLSYTELEAKWLATYGKVYVILVTHLVAICTFVDYEGKTYLLMPHHAWYRFAIMFENADIILRTVVTSVHGIPVLEDEDLVRKIIINYWTNFRQEEIYK